MALSEAEIDQIETLLFSEELLEDTVDYFGLHGLVSAATVGPRKISFDAMLDIVFGESASSLDEADLEHFKHCIEKISEDLRSCILDGKDIVLPYMEEQDFEDCLESWCAGFMEGFFFDEQAWFVNSEDVTAELLLPIMALSGLFESEEFNAIYSNEKLMAQFAGLIGDQLTDIFLFYHSEK